MQFSRRAGRSHVAQINEPKPDSQRLSPSFSDAHPYLGLLKPLSAPEAGDLHFQSTEQPLGALT